MPIYEYECTSCARRFEMKRGFSEADGVTCPHCACHTQRVFSPVPIIFKGAGFYVTDHRDGSRSSPSSDTDTVKAGSSEDKS